MLSLPKRDEKEDTGAKTKMCKNQFVSTATHPQKIVVSKVFQILDEDYFRLSVVIQFTLSHYDAWVLEKNWMWILFVLIFVANENRTKLCLFEKEKKKVLKSLF